MPDQTAPYKPPLWVDSELQAKVLDLGTRIGSSPKHIAAMQGLATQIYKFNTIHQCGQDLRVPPPQLDCDKGVMELTWINLRLKRSISLEFDEEDRLVLSRLDHFKCNDILGPLDSQITEAICWILEGCKFGEPDAISSHIQE